MWHRARIDFPARTYGQKLMWGIAFFYSWLSTLVCTFRSTSICMRRKSERFKSASVSGFRFSAVCPNGTDRLDMLNLWKTHQVGIGATQKMGCVSSKVAQKPPDQIDRHASRHEGNNRGQEAEESRPALPVRERVETKNLAVTHNKGQGNGRPSAGQRRQGNVAEPEGRSEGKEGETITDASGLQMRTPRTSGDPCLHSAAKNGDLSLVHMLLGNASTEGVASATSVENQQETTCSPTLDRTDLDGRGMWGNTPLLVATQYAHPQVALALIARGADTCLENERGATPLHFSCTEGMIDVGRALLNNGARVDPNVAAVHHPGVNGGQTVPVTPLSAAATGGHTELVRLLLQHGADVNRRISPGAAGRENDAPSFSGANGFDGSALTAAAAHGHTETCLALIDSGANMLLQDSVSRTPLLHAIRSGHERTAMALLDAARSSGCVQQLVEASETGVGVRKPWGSSPLHMACDKGLHEVTRAILVAGATVDSRDAEGATALLHACRKGRLECVSELVLKGASPKATDNVGDTPLSVARSRIDQALGEEILKLVETAVAAGAGSRDRGLSANRPHQEESEANGEDEDEDVLLVSDWDEDRLEMLDSTVHSFAEGQNTTHQNTNTIRRNYSEEATPSMNIRVSEDGDEDVLLVGDYEADLDEQTEFVEGPPPVAGCKEIAGLPELQRVNEGDSPGAAISRHSDCMSGCAIPGAREVEVQPSSGAKDEGRDCGDESHFEDRPPGLSKLTVRPPAIVLTSPAAHEVMPQELTSKLIALQVALESVDRAMSVAADNALAGQPQPSKGA